MAEEKGYEDVERDPNFITVDEKAGDKLWEIDESPEKGDDGKFKNIDEYGNPIDHGFLGPRGRK